MLNSIVDAFGDLMEQAPKGGGIFDSLTPQVEIIKFMQNGLTARFQQRYEEMVKMRAGITDDKERVIHDYLVLQAQLQVPSLIKMMTRPMVLEAIQNHEEYLAHMTTSWAIPDLKRWIDYHNKDIEKSKDMLSRYKDDSKMLKIISDIETDSIKGSEKRIRELELDLLSPSEYTIRMCGDPKKLRDLLPSLNKYDRLVMDEMGGEVSLKTQKSVVTADDSLTESQATVEFFMNRFMAQAKAKLARYNPKTT